jgi:hypothetical protein
VTTEPAIQAALEALHPVGEVFEVRIPGTRQGVLAGYFDSAELAAKAVADADARNGAAGIYHTLNPIDPRLLARSCNRLQPNTRSTTSDGDVARRTRLFVDLDPVRPADISATDEEHRAAIERGDEVLAFLEGCGFINPLVGDSGNGVNLIYEIHLPNDDTSRLLVERVLKALDLLFTDDRVKIDTTVSNAARIAKVYGTMACKGDDTTKRPHRRSKLLQLPKPWKTTPREALEIVAAMLPMEERRPELRGSAMQFDLGAFILENQIAVHHTKPYDGGTCYVLRHCLFDDAHTGTCAMLLQRGNGQLGYRCFHESCQRYHWHDIRMKYERGRSSVPTRAGATGHDDDEDDEDAERAGEVLFPDLHPKPTLNHGALHGVAGDFVRLVGPESEADDIALLLQFLTCAGIALGANLYIQVESTRHYPRINTLLVGSTGDSRKGTSGDHVRRLFSMVDASEERPTENFVTHHFASGLVSGEGAYQRCAPNGEETSPGDRRVVFFEPEFQRILSVCKREGNNLSANIRELYDHGTLEVLRRKDPLKVRDVHAAVVAHITGFELLHELTSVSMANGFVNRFVLAHVEGAQTDDELLPFGGAKLQDRQFATIARKLSAAMTNAAARPREIVWSEAARPLYADFYRLCRKERRHRPPLIAAMLARIEANTLRLALTFAALDCSQEIRLEHLRAAIAIAAYNRDSVLHLFGSACGDKMATKILDALRNTYGVKMTLSEIRRKLFGDNVPASSIREALEFLLASAVVEGEVEATRGRTRKTYKASVISPVREREKRKKALPDPLITLITCTYGEKNDVSDDDDAIVEGEL